MKTLLLLLSTTLLAQQTQVDYLRQLKNQPLLISDNNNIPYIHEYKQATTSGLAETGILFTGITGQQWAMMFKDGQFSLSDKTASDYRFITADKGMSGNDGIFIHHGYTALSSVGMIGSSVTPLPGGVAGFWVQGGAGMHLVPGPTMFINGLTTGAAGGRKVLCWDPSTGEVLPSSTSTDCTN